MNTFLKTFLLSTAIGAHTIFAAMPLDKLVSSTEIAQLCQQKIGRQDPATMQFAQQIGQLALNRHEAFLDASNCIGSLDDILNCSVIHTETIVESLRGALIALGYYPSYASEHTCGLVVVDMSTEDRLNLAVKQIKHATNMLIQTLGRLGYGLNQGMPIGINQQMQEALNYLNATLRCLDEIMHTLGFDSKESPEKPTLYKASAESIIVKLLIAEKEAIEALASLHKAQKALGFSSK